MKRLLTLIFVSTFLTSCISQDEESVATPNEQQRKAKGSLVIEAVSNLSEPFFISEIEQLQFTSGGVQSVNNNEYCDTVSKGFFGSYYLINRDFEDKNGIPVGGTIIVHALDKMKGWKANDTTQTIWKINLKSDVISVWDSIHVGLTRNEIENFNHINNGLCIKKGDACYYCDFNNFSVVYIFESDTLKEITITRECGENKVEAQIGNH